jgi:competence protein CoiA
VKFALVNSIKAEATKGAKGICPSCGSELIVKCGDVNINHWAHKGVRNCDLWWENETEWHRSWKDNFPREWQEVVHTDKNGERHIADVKTDENWVLEFQHSYIKPEERHSRNTFYTKLVWIIDGLRRDRDKKKFLEVVNNGSQIKMGNIIIYRVGLTEESKLLDEWLSSGVPVFFDFQESTESDHCRIWFLIPKVARDIAYLIPFSRNNFIQLHTNRGFNEIAYDIIPKIKDFIIRFEQRRNPIIFNVRRRYRRPL